jgi:tellurite resistance-related uncharacterized protein
VERGIVSFHRDVEGAWVARLECGHRQHVRHRPPFQLRPWVEDAAGRAGRLGTPLDCPLCDRAELPEGLGPVRRRVAWDAETLPAAMRREHRVGPSTWAVLRVESGRVRFVSDRGVGLDPEGDREGSRLLEAGSEQNIPPGVPHRLELSGPVRLTLDFFAVPAAEAGEQHPDEPECEGGDPACLAGLVCEECGAVVGPDPHRPGCGRAGTDSLSGHDMR